MGSSETLRKQLAKAGVDVKTFDKVEFELLEEEEDEFEEEDEDCDDDDDEEDDDDDDDDDNVDEVGEEQNGSSGANGGLFVVRVAAKNAMDVWSKARSVVDKTGYWPIISDEVEQLIEYFELDLLEEDVQDTDQIVKLSELIDARKVLAKRYKKNLEHYDTKEGQWPSHVRSEEKYSPAMVQSEESISILFCSARESWRVLAALRWSGSNDGMTPDYHTAFLKHWHQKYGAELVCANMSTMELKVAKPPETKSDALTLAKEQFAYCPEIVTQRESPKTIAALAADLYKSPQWCFWWN